MTFVRSINDIQSYVYTIISTCIDNLIDDPLRISSYRTQKSAPLGGYSARHEEALQFDDLPDIFTHDEHLRQRAVTAVP